MAGSSRESASSVSVSQVPTFWADAPLRPGKHSLWKAVKRPYLGPVVCYGRVGLERCLQTTTGFSQSWQFPLGDGAAVALGASFAPTADGGMDDCGTGGRQHVPYTWIATRNECETNEREGGTRRCCLQVGCSTSRGVGGALHWETGRAGNGELEDSCPLFVSFAIILGPRVETVGKYVP